MALEIMVVNFHSSQNAGDLALLQMTIQQLRTNLPEARFTVAANYPDEWAVQQLCDRVVASPWRLAGGGSGLKPRWLLLRLFWGWLLAIFRITHLPGLNRTRWGKLFRAYQEADLVVAVSGNQFFSSGKRGWPLFSIAMAVDLAILFNKPLYIMPQSVGPFRYKWEFALLRKSYSGARKIFIRDFQSLEVAKRAGLPEKKVHFAPDPAFTFPPAAPEKALATLAPLGYQPGLRSIGATVIAAMPSYLHPSTITAYYQNVASSLDAMVARYNCHIFFFNQVVGPDHNEDDRLATEKVTGLMQSQPDYIHIVPGELDPALLKACYGCMDLFLASRLHSGIFAMGMGVPTVFVGYLTKTRGVLEAVGLQDYMVDLEQLRERSLFPLLEQAWLERETLSQSITARMKHVSEQVAHSALTIARDYLEKDE